VSTASSDQHADDAIPPLVEGELIDDRALDSREGDAFRLSDIADELVGLARNAPTPATIALYASWGSGKSSLGQILQGEFTDDESIAYARFNALKYAETPLRRHFLSQLAPALGVDDHKYGRDLYRTETSTDFKLSREGLARLIWTVVGGTVGLIAFVAVCALGIAALEKGLYWHNVGLTLRSSASGAILSAALLAALLALLSQSLSVDTTTEAPSSSEEFEKLFRELVADIFKRKKKSRRIVIFIDELDRCSPQQVVAVLETLRSFLEVEGCVFIVAADQQALEHAATMAARQATPANPGNPYYSAGSAYLDKIFQYQFPMPPLLPRRLSRFALDLVKDRPGVWQQIPNQAELVSVLVPTHVRSPRRVKALLNSFVLLFRLALMRAEHETLDVGVAARASEIAKLACLRTEFPLFAGDLQIDARLPELTRMLREHPELKLEEVGLHGVSVEAFTRAGAYARERLPVDEVMTRGSDDPAELVAGAPVVGTTASATTPDAEDDDAAGEERTRVEVNHARQLIRYLERTKDIPGPGRDLVFLESSGAAFGLPGELAEQIETDALDARPEDVVGALESLDEVSYHSALRLLARLVVEAIGIDARNALASLLAAVAASEHALDPVVDELLTAVASYSSGYELKPGDLEGALRLSLASESDSARRIRHEVAARDEAVSDADLAFLLLHNAARITDVQPGRFCAMFVSRLSDTEPRALADLLADLPDDTVEVILAHLGEFELDAEGLKIFAETASAAREAGHVELGEWLLRTLLGLKPSEARTAAMGVIPGFAPISNPLTIGAVLAVPLRRVLATWSTWLDAIDSSAVESVGDIDPLRTQYVLALWQKRFAPAAEQTAATVEEFEAAAAALARISPTGISVSADQVSELLTSLPPRPVANAAQAQLRGEQFDALWSLVELNLLSSGVVGSAVLADLATTLEAPVAAPVSSPVQQFVVAQATRALATTNAVDEFESALAESWMDEPTRLLMRARVAVGRTRLGQPSEDGFGAAELLSLKEQGTPDALSAVADWMQSYQPDPRTILLLVEPELAAGEMLDPTVRSAVEAVVDRWSPEEKAEVFETLALRYYTDGVGEQVLRLTQVQEADAGRVVEVLQMLFDSSGNKEQRERVLQLWAIARPAPERAQRTLADRIYIPLLDKGKDAIRIALANFDLVQHASGSPRERLKRALKEATQGDSELGKRADRKMRDAGWLKQKKKWWEKGPLG
jgi:hypothetical protein